MTSQIDRLAQALNMFPETDSRHWEVRAFLFGRLQHYALSRADHLRKVNTTSHLPEVDDTGYNSRWEDPRDTQGGTHDD